MSSCKRKLNQCKAHAMIIRTNDEEVARLMLLNGISHLEGRAENTDTELGRFISAQIHPRDMFLLMADSQDRQRKINTIKRGSDTSEIDKASCTMWEKSDDRVIHPYTTWYARIRW